MIEDIFEEKKILYEGKEFHFIKKTTILVLNKEDNTNTFNNKKNHYKVVLSIQIFLQDILLRPIYKEELPDKIINELMMPNQWEKTTNNYEDSLYRIKKNFFANSKKETFVNEVHSLYYGLIPNHVYNCWNLVGLKVNEFGKIINHLTLNFSEIPLIYRSLLEKDLNYKNELFLLENSVILIPIEYQKKVLCCICKMKDEYNKVCFEILNTFTIYLKNKQYEIILDSNDKRFLVLDDKKFQKEMNNKIKKLKGD